MAATKVKAFGVRLAESALTFSAALWRYSLGQDVVQIRAPEART